MKRYILLLLLISVYNCSKSVNRRALQKSHEKPQWLKWSEAFMDKARVDQQAYLVRLLKRITSDYLRDCIPIILYDRYTEIYDNLILEKLLTNFPVTYIHGQISENYTVNLKSSPEQNQISCLSYVIFLKDVMKCRDIIGEKTTNRVVVVARSSQWRVFEFLSREESRSFVNLLVIVQSENIMGAFEEAPYILYTHKLFIDALGTSKPEVLTSFQKNNFTRDVNLFPRKMSHGLAGHRFLISLSHQPPFVISRGRNTDSDKVFDGIEVRIVNLLAKLYNFTTDYREATEDLVVGSTEAVSRTVEKRKSNLGIGGIYVTQDKINRIGMTQWHSQDCAAFISLSSTALPKYRAIMGPFHWSVWLALTFVYLFGIIPLVFSDKHTLRPLIQNPEEIENMFWYVFGTFTNCFTFSGKRSWSKANKMTTKLLIGFYWIFTIIVTACYTGSIIAFVTLPVFPAVIDSVEQLLGGRFQIGTLDKGEWPTLFANSSDASSERLLRYIELVPNIENGLRNVTKAFFWNYAFLGSRAQLDYIVRTNFSTKSKRSALHISTECFVPFNVAFAFPLHAIYDEVLNNGLRMIIQSGIINKLKSDVEWEMMRSATGKLLAANSRVGGVKTLQTDDRALTLDDTQGMFLLLAAGFLLGGVALLTEWFGGCLNLCKGVKRTVSTITLESNPRSHDRKTPRESLDTFMFQSVKFNTSLSSNLDEEDYIMNAIDQNNVCNNVHRSSKSAHGSSNTNREHNRKLTKRHSMSPIKNVVIHRQAEDNETDDFDKRSDEIDAYSEMSKEIDNIFERVFGEENNHEDVANESIVDISNEQEQQCNE